MTDAAIAWRCTMSANSARDYLDRMESRVSTLREWMEVFSRIRVVDLEDGEVRVERLSFGNRGSRR